MPVVARNKKYSFYFLMALIAIAAVMIGFFTTYIRPSVNRSFQAPPVIHIHGAFAFGWVLLLLVQTWAVRYRNFRLHRSLGYFGLLIAAGILVTLLPAGMYQVRRDLSAGLGDTAISALLGIVTSGIIFGTLVGAGFIYRRKPKIHKRLLLLATIILLWPAWFRFRHYFPAVPRPDIWFGVVLADSLILVAWIADKRTYGNIHPVLLYGGLFIMLEHTLEILLYDSAPWRQVAKYIFAVLS